MVNAFRATTVFVEVVTRVLSSCVLDAFMEAALVKWTPFVRQPEPRLKV